MSPARGGGAGDRSRVLVLDVGSSSVRTRLFDARGEALPPGAGSRRPYRWRAPEPGAMEVSAESLLGHVVETMDAALAQARAAGVEVAAVAVSASWHGLLGLDREGAPVSPLLSWGDGRAWRTALELRRRMDEGAVHARTGCFLHPSYPAVKLAWLREARPGEFARAAAWLSFPEYLETRLFGRRRCSLSMASGTGLLDVHALRWDEEMLGAAGVDADALSPLVDAGNALRGLLPAWAERWPELADVPWFPALGDGACANVGSGAVGADRRALTVGTSAAVRALWEPAGDFTVPEGLWCYRLDARRVVSGRALSNGGNGVAFLRGLLRTGDGPDWDEEVAGMAPDSHGLTVAPYLVPERTPDWRDLNGAAFVGLSSATTPAHLVRAWMEAVAYRLAEADRLLDSVFGATAVVRAGGGALHASPTWAQIVADVLDRPLLLAAEREVSGRGAALVAGERLGWIADLADAPALDAVALEPDPARHARYRAGMERQRRLAEALGSWSRSD